jgi:hypothetical protein
VFRNVLFEADREDELAVSPLYETHGRLEAFDFDLDDASARERLREDLQYLDEHYFSRENHLRVDGRPLFYVYSGDALRGDVSTAFGDITADLDHDPYFLVDLPFDRTPDTHPISAVADGFTTYLPYQRIDDIAAIYHNWFERNTLTFHLGADAIDRDFFPVVAPGYDDTAYPRSEDSPVVEPSPERYARVCEQVRPYLADAPAVLVTSFNEWYEDTQIEPSEHYGTTYLERTRDGLTEVVSDGLEPAGSRIALEFNKTVVPAETDEWGPDTRELAFAAGSLRLTRDGEIVASYDVGNPDQEPSFVEGVYYPEGGDDRSWRWFGGPSARAEWYVPPEGPDPDAGVLVGHPMVDEEISARVYVDSERTDHVDFGVRGDDFGDYPISLVPDEG